MKDRALDLTDLGKLRERLRYRMSIFAASRNRDLMETYDWLGRRLEIQGHVEVDDLTRDQLLFALRRIHQKRRRAEVSDLSGKEFDDWLADHQRTRRDFARVTGRDPRGVSTWDKVPKWAEVVMDILDADPSLWTIETPKDYPHPPSHMKDRLVAKGLSRSEFAKLTGASEPNVQRWSNTRTAPGWVDLVLHGIETGAIHARGEKVWSNHEDDC